MIRSGRLAFMMCALATSAALSMGCSGDPGAKGDPGTAGPAGDRGDVGPGGEPGDKDTPSVSAVSPRTAYLDRLIEVQISGNATQWTDAAKLDFGAGITVEDTIVASPTSIIALITIDEGAEIGLHTVTVTDKDSVTEFTEAFDVKAPLLFEGSAGTLAQGSIFIGKVSQLDLSTPFDASGAPDYPYLTLDAGAGTSTTVQEAQTYGIDFLMFVDVNATAGDLDLRSVSGLADTNSLAPKAVPIVARSPLVLKEGNPNTNTLANGLESTLFSFTPGVHKLVTITASSKDPNASPAFVLLPPSGKFSELISYGPVGRIVTETADPFFVVYWDNTGAEMYDFDITVEQKDSDELEPNSTCDKAQTVAALSASLINLSLANADDQDWFRFTAGAADVGKAIHVVTSAGDANTDTLVEVFSGDCASPIPLGDPSSDLDYHEDHLSKPIPAAGTYYVKVSQSPFPFAGSVYNLDLSLVAGEIEPNDMCAQAQATSVPAAIDVASIATATDVDWYAINVAAADVGNILHVQTTAGEPDTDTFIEVFSGGCASPTLFGESSDATYHEDFFSDPIPAAGLYLIKVSNSTFGFAGSDYKLAISIAPPADVEPGNNTCAGATLATVPASLSPLMLASGTDQDWFKFTAAAGDIGKKVHAVTKPGQMYTDAVLEVFEESMAGMGCGAADANLVSLGVSSDVAYHEDLVSSALTKAGTYWVKVSYSTFYDEAGYVLTVNLE